MRGKIYYVREIERINTQQSIEREKIFRRLKTFDSSEHFLFVVIHRVWKPKPHVTTEAEQRTLVRTQRNCLNKRERKRERKRRHAECM